MTGSQENASSGLTYPDDMAGRRGTENAMLPDHKLLDSICSTNFGNQLHNLRVPKSSVTTNDQKSTVCTFGYGEEDGGNKGFTVMWLLKDGDLLAKTRCTRSIERVR